MTHRTVRIDGISKSYGKGEVIETLTSFGPLSRLELIETSNMHAWDATFERQEDAVKCCDSLKGFEEDNVPIKCTLFSLTGRTNGRIQVTGFVSWSENRLRQAFSRFGSIINCDISVKDGKHVGFITFKDPGCADLAIQKMNREIIQSGMLLVDYCDPKDKEPENPYRTTVIVKNFDGALPEVEFLSLFETFGKVDSYKIQKRGSLRFGYVQFKDFECAKKASDYLHDSQYLGADKHGKKLIVSILNAGNK